MKRNSARMLQGVVVATSAALWLGGVANAATYSVTGNWVDGRGTISLPLPPALGAAGPRNPVAGTVMQTGAALPGGGPATLTLPTNVISDVRNLEGFLLPVPNVIQLTTSIGHYGPTTATTVMASGGPGSFAYCPGATANPNCTTVAATGTQGTLNGILKYTAGPNKFGGTFKVLLAGVGKLLNKGTAALPPTIMTTMGGTVPALPFSGQSNPLGGTAPQPVGFLAYAGMYTGMQAGGVRTHPYGYMTTPDGLVSTGPVIGTYASMSNTGTIFGVTSGSIYAYQQFGAQSNDPGLSEKFTIAGYDKRTAAGAGRIVLVTASLTRGFPTDGSDPPEGSTINEGILTITMTPQPNLPLASPPALLTLGSLVALSAGYAISRRRL